MMVTTTASLQHSTFNQLRRQFFIVGFDLKSVVKILAKILGKRQSVPVQLQLITNQLLSPRNSHLKTCGRIEEKSLRLVSRQYNSVQNVHYSRQMNFSTQCRQVVHRLLKQCLFNVNIPYLLYSVKFQRVEKIFCIKMLNLSRKSINNVFQN